MGFATIIDILGATAIGGLLLLILLRLNGNVIESNFIYGSDRSLQQGLAETAMVVEEDLRAMGYCADPFKLTDGMSRVISADTSYLSFYTDIDDDGELDSIAYFISDTSALSGTKNPRDRILYRQVNTEPPFMVSTNIVQFKLNNICLGNVPFAHHPIFEIEFTILVLPMRNLQLNERG